MPMPHIPRKRQTPRGLTLLELMIAIAVVAVLVGVAAPSMSAAMARHRLRAAAEHLAADMGEARLEATRTGRPVHLSFHAGDHWCYVLSTAPQSDCRYPAATQLKVVRHLDHPGVTLQEASPQTFDASGGLSLAPPGQALLASPQGDQLRVRVSRMGRASVCAPGLPVPSVRPC